MKNRREFDCQRWHVKKLLRIMKLTGFLIFAFVISVNASGYSQSTKLKLDIQNSSLIDALKQIEDQSEFYFYYNKTDIGDVHGVSVNVDGEEIHQVMDQLLENTNLEYQMIDHYIVVKKKGQSDFVQPTGEPKTITGRVIDQSGLSLPGVTVVVQGTTRGTITDSDGNYTLTNVPGNAMLVFSFVGMKDQQIAVVGESSINVTMEEETVGVKEVVVTALGIKKQARSLGYSTTEVKGDDFTAARDMNLGNALTGKVAGVSVSNNATGAAGSSRVIIRGNASLTGNNQPLYVIDGVPFDNTSQGSAGQWGGVDLGDGLSNIDPDNIASVQVLKGAAASALYGFRGGNGAILISTKSGSKSKKVEVEFNNNLTFSTIIDYRDLQHEYGQGTQANKPTSQSAAYNTASSSWGAKMDGSDAVNFLGNTYSYSDINNWKNYYKTGLNNQSTIAVSGGSDQITYRVGLSNLYNKSVIPNSNMQQQGINLNTVYNISKKLQLTVTANYIFEKVNNRALLSDASTNINATMLYLANSFDVRWLKPAVNDDGTEMTPGNNLYFNNPYFLANYHKNSTERNRLTGGITLKYNLLDWLYVQGQVTRDGYIFDYRKVTPTGTAYANGGELTEYERNYHELNTNFLIGLNKDLGKSFSVGATFGGNMQDHINEYYGLDGTASPFIIPYLYTADNIANKSYTHDYAHYRVNSFYGTVDLGFNKYLFLNLTGRNDWFSTLDPQNNHYFYPSVSTSFVFTDALHLPDWISFGKLRLSYAEASNGTDPYQNSLSYGLKNYTVDGQPIGEVTNITVPNAHLKPVKIQEHEIGLSMQFLRNRIGFDAAVYQKKTTDDIATITSSSASGYSAAIMNVGKIRNRGFEAMLNAVPVKKGDFRWNTTFNIAINKSKVLYLGDGVSSLAIDGAVPRNGDGVTISNVVGLSYGQIMGYAYKRDADGNKIFDNDGQPLRTSTTVPLGSGVYKTTGGFSNDFHYKNWVLSSLFDYKFGAKIYSGTNLSLYYSGLQKTTLQGREGGYVGEGVTEDGSVNATAVDAETYWKNLANSNNIAEEFIYNASFIKLRELSLGYTIPNSLLRTDFVKSIKVSLVARNLATLMKHTPNIDPESAYNSTNGQGLESNGYPATRNFGFNLNVKF